MVRLNVTPTKAATRRIALGAATVLALGAALAAPTAHAAVFADFSPSSAKTDLTWSNTIVPAVYKTIPAVTKTIPAVTQTIPAVTKIVNGKVVVVTPAKTIIIKPAQTIIVTPAQKVLVTPAHDGPSGTIFSTTAANAKAYGLAQVNFAFLIYPLAGLHQIPAQFSFQGASPANDPAQTVGQLLTEANLSGTFSFTYDGVKPLKVWDTVYNPGANLLSGQLGRFLVDGAKGGGSGALLADTSIGDPITYTSDFLDFSHTNSRALSFFLLSPSTKFSADSGAALHTISFNAGGSFSTSPKPIPTAVPEPATWGLMILGLGAAGAMLRRRRRPLGVTA